MKKLNDLLARIPEMQARAKQRAEREPLPGKPLPKNVVQLPLWPEPVRAVPNGFLRSALFGAIARGKRRYIDGEQLAALDGVEIRYKGQRLDQGDLDVCGKAFCTQCVFRRWAVNAALRPTPC